VKRNKLANASIFMVTALFVAMVLVTNPSYATTDKPNIVLMMADNLGYGDLGVYGGGENRGMPTPNIDKLANEGLRFDQFLVEHNCTPTRAATMTGRYAIRSMLSGSSMQGSAYTLAEMLKDIGYTTAAYGKWHLGFDEDKGQQPQQQGFDKFYGIKDSTNVVLYPSSMLEQGVDPGEPADDQYIYELQGDQLEVVKPYNEETRSTIDGEIADRAVKYINTHAYSPKPFFLYVPWTRVHSPNFMSEEFEGKSRIGNYGDAVMELDYHTGRVLEALRHRKIENDTIVIWMSDNGPMRTSVWPDGGSQGPYRGDIGSAHEGSIRTAGMIKWRNHIQAGVMYEMFSTMDFFPTLAKFVGAEAKIPKDLDGIDQSDFILNYKPPVVRAKECQEVSEKVPEKVKKMCQKVSDVSEKVSEKVKKMCQNICQSLDLAPPRDHLLTFINGKLMAIRWKQFRIYFSNFLPQEGFMAIEGSSSMNVPNLNPIIYNVERDPREVVDTLFDNSWAISRVMPYVTDYVKSLAKHPNPPLVAYPNMLPQNIFMAEYIEQVLRNKEALKNKEEKLKEKIQK
jgi:arylsulfatase A-like enzyme